ncbi:MAG TPA: transporter [Cycloclasticus sp.]|nr:transporter [Cycloclasticus sp.]
MGAITNQLKKIDRLVFAFPKVTAGVILAITAFFAMQIPAVKMVSNFADLLPQGHEYIQTHNTLTETFGGANTVIVDIKVDEGTIFTNDVLARIKRLTDKVDALPAVNHNLVNSLTHRNTRRVWLNEYGTMKSAPYYDPLKEHYSDEELQAMQNQVVANPRVYGLLVSPDLKSALIKGTLNEGDLDYEEVFNALTKLRDEEQADGLTIYASGQPVLVGWVTSYVSEVIQIFGYTLAILLILLVAYFRKLYGLLLPLIGIALTTTWGLGMLSLLGYNLDPLMLVVPFLVSARAMSHGVQIVERFYSELGEVGNKEQAARNTFEGLFRPGSLGVISDAIGLLLISLGTVPINDKLAIYASLWAGSVIVTVLIFLPVMLQILPQKGEKSTEHPILEKLFPVVSKISCTRKGALTTLFVSLGLVIGGVYLSSKVQIGESESGSPLLYADHDYNVSANAINSAFPGSEEMFILAHSDKPHGLKQPDAIKALADFQNYMMLDPELGGTKGLPDLLSQASRIIRNDDPRWLVYPKDEFESGGLMFAYMMSSPIPGALLEFIDPDEQNANIVFYYKDHKGETIRRAIHMVKEWSNSAAAQVEGFSLKLAGGLIGVTAAVNEASYETNVVVIPLVFLLILVFVTAFYWSVHAGWLMLLAMGFATTLTYAYMGIVGLGINVNTVPILAAGIGIGVDYSIYIMDKIKEQYAKLGSFEAAIEKAINTTGVAIGFTAFSLIAGVIMWVLLSTMRFQADAAMLLIVMLLLNALAAMFLVPAWVMTFKPKFIQEK